MFACFASIAEYQRHFGKRLYIKEGRVNLYGTSYVVQYITKSEFNTYKTQYPDKAFGDFFLLDKEVA